jgi:capsular polysaccharide biosynthesis protein
VKKQESQVAANLERRQIGEQFKTLDAARLPEKPSSPDRPKLYAMGFMAALAVGLLCAGVAEYRDNALRSEADVKLVLNLFVLATVPVLEPVQSVGRRRRLLAVSMTAGVVLAGVAAAAWKLFLR